ncbi:MAG: hypothetical protein E6Q94_05675 [Burkholderiaceae bacterium]|nr:MAG: hypothetical protein E6Q94_05675 [Burkholderiaceae bacterium]
MNRISGTFQFDPDTRELTLEAQGITGVIGVYYFRGDQDKEQMTFHPEFTLSSSRALVAITEYGSRDSAQARSATTTAEQPAKDLMSMRMRGITGKVRS